MKKVVCPTCGDYRWVEDNIIMAICKGCQEEMEVRKDEFRR